jgi:hypothetical protein
MAALASINGGGGLVQGAVLTCQEDEDDEKSVQGKLDAEDAPTIARCHKHGVIDE